MDNYKNFAGSTLTNAISNSDTSITVFDGSMFPTAPFRVTIDTEILYITAKVSDTVWAVTRGYDGSVATTHNQNILVEQNWSAGDVKDFADAMAATHNQADAVALGVL